MGRGKKRTRSESHEDAIPNHDNEIREKNDASTKTQVVKVNRAPVLTMWVAVVAEREGYSFREGLSFGKAVAGIFAHSKGRRLGVYEDTTEEHEHRSSLRTRRENPTKFQVFGMQLLGRVADNGERLAVQNGKPISPSTVEAYLHKAFGDHYQSVKVAMESLAKVYEDDEKEIGSVAYSLYEGFRPQVGSGIEGWGAKGSLDLNLLYELAQHKSMPPNKKSKA